MKIVTCTLAFSLSFSKIGFLAYLFLYGYLKLHATYLSRETRSVKLYGWEEDKIKCNVGWNSYIAPNKADIQDCKFKC